MTKRKRIFIISLITLILLIGGAFYYLFFTNQLGIFADLTTGPKEKVISSKTAQEIFSSAQVKDRLRLTEAGIELEEGAEQAILIDELSLDEFQAVRRFLWQAETPAASHFSMMIRTSVDGENWSSWSERSQRDWYYLKIDRSVEKVQYLATFGRQELIFPLGDYAKQLEEKGIEIEDYGLTEENFRLAEDQGLADREEMTTADEEESKTLYAHLFINGEDKGRYLGALVDTSGSYRDVFHVVFLTDQMAFVSERYEGSMGPENPLVNFLADNNKKIYFVDEANGDQIEGIGRLVSKSQEEAADWEDRGDYLANIVDISGMKSDWFGQISITNDADSLVMMNPSRGEGLSILNNNSNWHNLTRLNSRRYQNLAATKDLMANSRLKFVPVEDSSYQPVESDGFAKLSVGGSTKGYYVGSGVNLSGRHSDVFFPVWITNNRAWVGAGELDHWIFYLLCNNDSYICGHQTADENSQDYSDLESVDSLRGLNSQVDRNQELTIFIKVKKAEAPQEPLPEEPETGLSPKLIQVGLSTGYSAQETPDREQDQINRKEAVNQIPGWLKGGLIKTGSDIIVLIIITILIVISIIYLVSLLKNSDDIKS